MPTPADQLHAQRAVHRAEVTAVVAAAFTVVLVLATVSITLWWALSAVPTGCIAVGFALRAAYSRGYLAASMLSPAAAPVGFPPHTPAAVPGPDTMVAGNGVIPVVFTRFAHPVTELDGGIDNEHLRRLVQRLAASQGVPGGRRDVRGGRPPKDQPAFEQLWSPLRTVDGTPEDVR